MRVLGIDLSSLYRRFWEARSGRAEQGAETCAACVDWVARNREGFDRVAVALDPMPEREGGERLPLFRKSLYAGYKSSRQAHHPAYDAQLRMAANRLAADGCHVLKATELPWANGFYCEADDMLASLAQWCRAEEHELVIATSDKDLLQLSDGAQRIAVMGIESGQFIAESDIGRKLGVKDPAIAAQIGPAQVADMLILMGDKGDDIPGIDGIGPAAAAEIIIVCGSALHLAKRLADDGPEVFGKFSARVAGALPRAGIEAVVNAIKIGSDLVPLCADCGADWGVLAEPAPVIPLAQEGYYPSEQADAPTQSQKQATSPSDAQADRAAEAMRAEIVGTPEDGRDAIVLRKRDGFALAPYSLQPESQKEAWVLSKIASNSRVIPLATAEQAHIALLRGRELGVPAGVALTCSYVVKGKIGWPAAVLAALVKQAPDCQYFHVSHSDDKSATVKSKKRGKCDDGCTPECDHQAKTLTYTLEEAKLAGLYPGDSDSNWRKRPATMLRWAAMREAARAFWPERVTGVHTPDELRAGHAAEDELE